METEKELSDNETELLEAYREMNEYQQDLIRRLALQFSDLNLEIRIEKISQQRE